MLPVLARLLSGWSGLVVPLPAMHVLLLELRPASVSSSSELSPGHLLLLGLWPLMLARCEANIAGNSSGPAYVCHVVICDMILTVGARP